MIYIFSNALDELIYDNFLAKLKLFRFKDNDIFIFLNSMVPLYKGIEFFKNTNNICILGGDFKESYFEKNYLTAFFSKKKKLVKQIILLQYNTVLKLRDISVGIDNTKMVNFCIIIMRLISYLFYRKSLFYCPTCGFASYFFLRLFHPFTKIYLVNFYGKKIKGTFSNLHDWQMENNFFAKHCNMIYI